MSFSGRIAAVVVAATRIAQPIVMKANKLRARIPGSLTVLLLMANTLSATAQSDEVTFAPLMVMYTAKRSNVRAGPGTGYGKVGLLEAGEQVFVLAKSENWFRLFPKAGQRFVYAPLLTAARHEPSTSATKKFTRKQYLGD